mmetsp:Transcript_28688/g.28348  ORF Transcript_28688/g.28348 Transcript_28688/m.28348 type:complete len:120 (+) Transcript_28688:15-374(+)
MADVLWEDQQRINRFSYLNMRSKEIDQDCKTKEEKFNALQDAVDELELSMEGSVRVMIGECLIQCTEEEAIERLEKVKDQKRHDLEVSRGQLEDVQKEMLALKSYLYARFGTNINLEED